MTDDEELAEWLKRLVPASDEEIIALAERLWSDPQLQPVFQRIGYHGDASDPEQQAIDATIDAYRQGRLWDRDREHLALAPCLVRQLAAGVIGALNGEDAKAFLADRRIERVGALMRPRKASEQELQSFARAIRNNSAAWEVIIGLAENPDQLVDEYDTGRVLYSFQVQYQLKYGLMNRGGLCVAIGLLRDTVR